ncbi:carbohydrate binding domain-containing protein [Nibricoccus sp. IMCC34717]|uniref:carbohydrate binding domain-containing protein n=1 Tax=Nibricoccus sp. IMCC34717 TaxID=3034021 RepID=UPI00384C817C
MPFRLLFGFVLALAASAAATAAAEPTLSPFALPTSPPPGGATDFSSWSLPITPASAWVAVDPEGHCVVDGSRIRFLGTSIVADEAFVSASDAARHAARLAHFGFNCVRFHLIDAAWKWDGMLIDYPKGNSRSLNAQRLDSLQRFIASLADKGIYTTLNLIAGRDFQPADGLGADIRDVDWKVSHALAYFDDDALALHQEFATQLLSAPNPHRGGTPLALDPAVAFVELMNENGLLHQWFSGNLDTLKPRFLAKLSARWNAWLAARYSSDAQLESAWQARREALGVEMLANASFSEGSARWTLEQHAGARATTAAASGPSGGPALRITTSTPGSESWHVQLQQGPLTLEKGRLYTLRFRAKGDAGQYLTARLEEAGPPWTLYTPGVSIQLSSTWTDYSLVFEPAAGTTNARFNFTGFGLKSGSIWLADASVRLGGEIGTLGAGISLGSSNVPTVGFAATGGGSTRAQRLDWIRFLVSLEQRYNQTMLTLVRDTLGYRGIVWGSINATSTPSAQAMFRHFDAHAYWQHPRWPAGQDWWPKGWSVQNVSMLASATASTLPDLAAMRIAGASYSISEYQHPSPNTFGSEAPLLLAAYAGLQDWDAIYFYNYPTSPTGSVSGFFDHANHSGKMANTLIAASLFRRADVSRARNVLRFPYSPEREAERVEAAGRAWALTSTDATEVPRHAFAVSRVALDPAATGALPEAPAVSKVLVSDTNELTWDTREAGREFVTINTARTKAVLGFNARADFKLGSLTVSPGPTRQGWSTVALTLTSGDSLEDPAGWKGLIVCTGDQENTGQKWRDSTRDSVDDQWGTAPTRVECVQAVLSLPVSARRVRAWALNADGTRGDSLVPVSVGDTETRLLLGGSMPTLWYELEVIAEAAVSQPARITSVSTRANVLSGEGVMVAGVSLVGDSDVLLRGVGPELARSFGLPHTLADPRLQWHKLGGAEATLLATNDSWDAVGLPAEFLNRGMFALQDPREAALLLPVFAGNYSATVSGADAIGGEAIVEIYGAPESAGYFRSISTRALAVPSGLVVGFSISGTQPLPVLVRGVGPGLRPFGIEKPAENPRLTLHKLKGSAAEELARNDDWDSRAPWTTAALFQAAGAFPLAEGSTDAALSALLDPGLYTATLQPASGEGIAIVEVYSLN